MLPSIGRGAARHLKFSITTNPRAALERARDQLAIEQEGDFVMLRIKHFSPGPGLVGRQAKEEAVNHALVRVAERTAVFEGVEANPARVTFTRHDADNLTITVERMRDGKLASTDFKYSRIKP